MERELAPFKTNHLFFCVIGVVITSYISQNKNVHVVDESETGLPSDSAVIREWAGSRWEIALQQEVLTIKTDGWFEEIPYDGTIKLETKRRWFRWHLLKENESHLKLKGLSRIEARLLAISYELGESRIWSLRLRGVLADFRHQQRWVPQELIEELIKSKPLFQHEKELKKLGLEDRLNQNELQALIDLNLNLRSTFEELNQEILNSELINQKTFLDCIESQPLSLEQAKAVITFDNRVLLVAAAGSGKTSVMVARAAYATMKNFIKPSKILLLAFNRVAAVELQERVKNRFENANIDSTGIKASTFHAFGLDVIGKGLGARPSVAPWVENKQDTEEVAKIVFELKESSEDFKYKWDLYRLIFPAETLKVVDVDPDAWDSESKEQGFRTFDGKIVRSHGERMIANWLYLHGVSYQYERDYKILTADAFHRQYKPDFYYPDIDAWHEHWALDQRGNPPPDFVGYLKDIEFKRNLHASNNTDLIETTFGEVVFDNGLAKLKENLLSRGIKLNWDPDRPKAEFTNIEDSEMIKLVRTFMTHIKSNSLSAIEIESRLNQEWNYLKSDRTALFLDFFWLIYSEWNRRLSAASAIDFEDMLIQAAHVIENRKHIPDYDLILVDEFQDSSAARARLVKSLLNVKGKYILAVGDDWQSINRFAGADVSLMSHFHESFGRGPTLHLSRTYRSTQTIADVATKFVTKNPDQIKKQVVADQGILGNPIILIRAGDEQQGVRDALQRISEDVKISGSNNASVYILGRYKKNIEWVPNDSFPNLKITYRTIHGSKGLEADYVVLVNLESGRRGFPSEIEDDPILHLAMSELEAYEHAEERRLLYVALTRARKQTFLVARQNKESMFAVELMLESLVVTVDPANSGNSTVQVCTVCEKGVMRIISGPYSNFLSCSRWPTCLHRSKLT